MDSRNSVQFLLLQKISINYTLLSIHWLNSRTLALVDVRERLHVVDVRSQEELETVDLTQVRLVYASSHFKGLATGGNVSKAFVSNIEKLLSLPFWLNAFNTITGYFYRPLLGNALATIPYFALAIKY